jgi:urease accessory protein
MLRCFEALPPGSWPTEAATAVVVLDLDARRRRRQRLEAAGGLVFLLDLPAAPSLADGAGLVLEDGRIVRVEAAAEALIEVAVDPASALPRIAWHLGNRHLPVEFAGARLRLRPDHVIEAMLVQLGATVRHIQAPFEPEGGAYGHGHTDGHEHEHDHGHGDRPHRHEPHAHGHGHRHHG